jgi:hypothetical protein
MDEFSSNNVNFELSSVILSPFFRGILHRLVEFWRSEKNNVSTRLLVDCSLTAASEHMASLD